jgi:hypothetical protein
MTQAPGNTCAVARQGHALSHPAPHPHLAFPLRDGLRIVPARRATDDAWVRRARTIARQPQTANDLGPVFALDQKSACMPSEQLLVPATCYCQLAGCARSLPCCGPAICMRAPRPGAARTRILSTSHPTLLRCYAAVVRPAASLQGTCTHAPGGAQFMTATRPSADD